MIKSVNAILLYKDEMIYSDSDFKIDTDDIQYSESDFLTQAIIALDADYLENVFTVQSELRQDAFIVLAY